MKDFMKYIEESFKGNDFYKKERQVVNNFFNEIKGQCSRSICLNIKKIINKDKVGD